MTNNKNMNKKFTFAISSKAFMTVILLIGLVISPLTANNLSSIDMTYAEEENNKNKNKYNNINNTKLSKKIRRKKYFTL